MGRIHEYLATLSILLARVVLLENGEIYMKRFRGLWFVSLEASKMYLMMSAFCDIPT